MLKKYLGDIAFMQMLNLLIKPIWILIIDRAVQDALPLDVYGNYAALFNFSLLFFIVLDLGLNSYNTTQVSRDETRIADLTGNIIGLKIVLSFVYLILASGVGLILGYTSTEFGLLAFLFLLQIITSMNQYFRSIVNALQKFKWDGVFMVLDRVLIVALCTFLLWGGIEGWELTIERFIYAQLAGVLLVLGALIVFLRSYWSQVHISFHIQKLVPILKKSWPFALLISLMGLFNYFDSVMIKSIRGDAEAGVYAMGYRLYYALMMFAQIFSGVLLAFFSKNIAEKTMVNKVGSYTIKLLMLVGLSAAFVCMAYRVELIELLYPNKASLEASDALSILMFGFLGSALVLVYGTLLTAALELRTLNIAGFVTLCVNVVLNLYLIPQYGAVGAAVATLVSQFTFGGVCYVVSIRKFKFSIVPKTIMLQVIGVAILFLTTVYFKQYFTSVFVHLSVITMSIIALAYMFRLYRAKDFKSLLNKR